MKKLFRLLSVVTLLFILVSSAIAGPPFMYAYRGTGDYQVLSGTGLFGGILIATDGTNNPTVTVYDYVGAGGTELLPTTEFVAVDKNLHGFILPNPVVVTNGIYVDVTLGAGTMEYTVFYNPQASYR